MGKLKTRLSAWVRGENFKSEILTVIVVGVLVAANIIIYVLGSFFGWYLYTPYTDDLTISGATDELFADAVADGRRVTIMFCQAEDDILTHSTGNFVLNTAKQLQEKHSGLIELEFVNIITKRDSQGRYVDLSKYQTEGEGGEKIPIYKSSVIFISGENYKVVTDMYTSAGYVDFYTLDAEGNAISYNGEEMLASMVRWVLTSEHKTAYFTTFHGETADTGFRNMLVSSGYNVSTINLKTQEIPADAELIVISNPKNDFERAAAGTDITTEIERLRKFMNNGGNLYVALDPYVDKLPVLESFIAEYGIEFATSPTDSGVMKNIVRDSDNAITADFFTLVANYADTAEGAAIKEKVEKYNSASVILSSASALVVKEGAEPLLTASPSSRVYAGADLVGSDGNYCIGATATRTNDEGEVGRMFVVPSIYLTASDALLSGGYSNREFVYSVLDIVFGAQSVPYGCNTVYYSQDTLENLTMKTARIYTVLIMALPVALAVVGAVVTIKRKNR